MFEILYNKSRNKVKQNKQNPLTIHVIIPQGRLQGTKGYVSKLLTQLYPVFISPLPQPPHSTHQYQLPDKAASQGSSDGFHQPKTARIDKIHFKGGTCGRQELTAHPLAHERGRTGSRILFSALPSRASHKHCCFGHKLLCRVCLPLSQATHSPTQFSVRGPMPGYLCLNI